MWKPTPQGETGDPARQVILISRDWLVGRTMDRIQSENRLILPAGVSTEALQHYTANTQAETLDRHGNFRGFHWERKRLPHGRRARDDWMMASAYSEFAAVLLGLDKDAGRTEAGARADAEATVKYQMRNRDRYRRARQDLSQELHRRRRDRRG